MQKNKFFILWIVFICLSTGFISNTFATECTIKNGPTKELAKYVSDLNASLNKLTKSWTPCGTSAGDTISKIWDEISKIYNRKTNFSNFTSSSNFWIQSAINATMPYEYIRDHQLLARQTDKIQRAMDVIYSRCNSNNSTDNDDARNEIRDYLADNINLTQAFELAATRNGEDIANLDFVYQEDDDVAKSFTSTGSYGSDLKETCNNASPSSNMTSIFSEKIGSLWTWFSASLKNWKDAWKLLTGGSNTKEYKAAEKALLKKELGKQGLSTEQSTAILRRLTDFQNDEYTGMAGFLQNITDRAKATSDSFAGMFDKIRQDLYNAYTTPNTHEYSNKLKQLWRTQELLGATTGKSNADNGDNISADYQIARTLLNKDNIQLSIGIGHLKTIHDNLNDAIGKIRENQAKAASVCNKQWQGLGNCRCTP